MTDEQLLSAAIEARKMAHNTPIYGGSDKDADRVSKAVRSSMRATAVSGRYLDLMAQCKRRGLEIPSA